MTYKNLKKFLSENYYNNDELIFDLIPQGIKSKIIFTVGNGACNTSALLSSIMTECDIPHCRYTSYEGFDIKNRFIRPNGNISTDELCQKADYFIQKTKKQISSELLLFILAQGLLDSEEYLIIDISTELYEKISLHITPFAVVLATNDEEKGEQLIALAPKGTKEIIALTQKNNFDFISKAKSINGARITYASPNKINISNGNILGTEFFHYDFKYIVPLLDQSNLPLAHLAIEAAIAIFSPPRQRIARGLQKSSPPDDFELYSLSPVILLRSNTSAFTLHHKLDFEIIREPDEIKIPTRDTIFCGSSDFISKVKTYIK